QLLLSGRPCVRPAPPSSPPATIPRNSTTPSERKAAMPGKFVVKKGPTGKFRFSLLSTNGQVVASSEAYETKRAALSGVASVQKLLAGAENAGPTARAGRPR